MTETTLLEPSIADVLKAIEAATQCISWNSRCL
jgi:hypothetical protein